MDNGGKLYGFIRNIPDFPQKGIIFRDITPLLADGTAFRAAVRSLAELCPDSTEIVAGVESRGFIFAAAVAHCLGVGLVPIRKPGKLPYRTEKEEYALEYGRDSLEIHRDALKREKRVVLIDDLLATGGTAAAAGRLLEKVGGEVLKIIFLVELSDLNGRAQLKKHDVASIIRLGNDQKTCFESFRRQQKS